jgi:hypothetical protein
MIKIPGFGAEALIYRPTASYNQKPHRDLSFALVRPAQTFASWTTAAPSQQTRAKRIAIGKTSITATTVPGFRAHLSLYSSRIHYGAAGVTARREAGTTPASLGTPLEFPAAHALLSTWREVGGPPVGYDVGASSKTVIADVGRGVVPTSVPAHRTDLSGQCNACFDQCLAIEIGCGVAVLTAAIACGPFYPLCFAAGAAACIAAQKFCNSNCENIGNPCCPVACGPSCCGYSETCSDTGQGLCCSAGTQPCGTNCCEGDEVCLEGTCCPRGSSLCPDGTCCDNICRQCQGGTCVPLPDGTPCAKGMCCCGFCTRFRFCPPIACELLGGGLAVDGAVAVRRLSALIRTPEEWLG